MSRTKFKIKKIVEPSLLKHGILTVLQSEQAEPTCIVQQQQYNYPGHNWTPLCG